MGVCSVRDGGKEGPSEKATSEKRPEEVRVVQVPGRALLAEVALPGAGGVRVGVGSQGQVMERLC